MFFMIKYINYPIKQNMTLLVFFIFHFKSKKQAIKLAFWGALNNTHF